MDGLAGNEVKTLTIISGKDNLTQSAVTDYYSLKEELAARSIVLEWRIIDDKAFKWHDRWIVSDSNCYNIPPVLAIIRGQRSEIIQTEVTIDIECFLKSSHIVEK